MKIALCFSGLIRDVNENQKFWNELIQKYNIDVYASLWDVENLECGDTVDNFIKTYSPKKCEVENYKIFKQTTQDLASLNIESPTSIAPFFQQTSKNFGQLSMYYKVWKCNMLYKESGIDYDIVIRARTDTFLDDKFKIVKNNMLNVPIGNVKAHWDNSYGINDCFAYGPPKIMDYYSFIFLQMMQYLKEGHTLFPPEHFLAVHFSKIHIQIRYLSNYITITRASKGTPYELYNNFVNDMTEYVVWSNDRVYIPQPHENFKRDIVNDFVI